MKTLLVFLLLAIAVPANASVWLMVFAGDKEPLASPHNYCTEDGNTHVDSLTNQVDCEAAGHTWVDENMAGKASKGDIMTVRAGSVTQFGGAECMNWPPADGGNVVCVEITDKDEAHARNYIKKRLDSNLVEIEQYRFYVDIASLPAAIKTTLNTTGTLSRTWAQVKPFIMDKTTGEAVP